MRHSRGLLPDSWSPDGAVLLAQDGGALVALPVGSEIPPRLVAPALTGATWSPVADRIAARRGRDVVVLTPGSRPRTVARAAAPLPSGHDAAAWSPDGRELAIAPGGPRILVVAPDGGSAHEFRLGGRGDAADPTWSPDGTRIAASLRGGIWVAGADGSAPAPVRVATGSRPAWSPSGSRIAFVGPRAARNGVVAPDGSGAQALPGCRCDLPGALAVRTVAWSSGGGRLAYVSGPGNEVSTIRADGSDRVVAVRFPGPPTRRVLWIPVPG